MRLSSGYVIVGAYADKIRKTLFAQLRDLVKTGKIDSKEIARAAAELNRLLYEIFVNELKVEKGDVTRVRVDYRITNKKINWNLTSLEIEVFKRVPDNEVSKVVKNVIERAKEITEAAIPYEIEEAGKTDLGDVVYYLKLNKEFAGALIVTPLNDVGLVRGAITRPTALIIDKTKIDYRNINSLNEALQDLIKAGRNVENKEALKVINEIKGLIGEEKEEYLEPE